MGDDAAGFSDADLDAAVTRRLAEERALLSRRLAPGGTPLWILPDQDLEAAASKLASSSRAQMVEITYYFDEIDRRAQRKATRTMVRLTWVIVALTVAVVVLAAVTLVVAIVG